MGSNDYYAPHFKNPAVYLTDRYAKAPAVRPMLPTDECALRSRPRVGSTSTTPARRWPWAPRGSRSTSSASMTRTSSRRLCLGLRPCSRRHSPHRRCPPRAYQRVLNAMVADGADWSSPATRTVAAGPLVIGAPSPTATSTRPAPGPVALVARSGLGEGARCPRARHRGTRHTSTSPAGLGTSPLRPGALRLPPRSDPAHPRTPRVWNRFRVCRGSAILGVALPSGRAIATGCGAALVARFVRDEEVAGSNPVTPTMFSQVSGLPSPGSGLRHGQHSSKDSSWGVIRDCH